mmetsp:Transcript_2654/g.5959  ORF Transcript_2654/g.5959 Transcript_2654/m.5959 type:complete len:402 (+) Transcript_2654:52-1257(+)
MGCTPCKRNPQSSPTAEDYNGDIFSQISSDTRRASHKISLQEQDIILSTLNQLQFLEDSNRKLHWFHVIQNEVLYPLVKIYYKALTLGSFTPDPAIVDTLRVKDFDHFRLDHEQMIVHLMHCFYDPALAQRVGLSQLEKFIKTVGINYLDNPFHNFRHAFSVVQIIYSMSAITNEFVAHLKPLEYFTLLVAAVGHDIDHPGVTNAFLVNSRHCLAKRYNDTSVLENHHTATLLKILETEDTGLLSTFSSDIQRNCRKSIIQTILSTDLANHNSVMASFSSTVSGFQPENAVHRQNIMNMLLHTADVGNPCLDFSIAKQWSMKIIAEFNSQVLQEEDLKLPVSEFLRIGTELPSIKKSQVGFIDFIILPLWKLVEVAYPELQAYKKTTEANRETWANLQVLD